MNRVLALLFTLVLASSPVWAQKRIEEIAVRVNGDIILKSDIERELDLRRTEMAQQGVPASRIVELMEEQQKTVVRDLIDKRLLVQLAKEANVNADLDVLKTMEELRTERKYATMEELESAIIKDYGDLEEFKNDIREKYMTEQVIQHEVYQHIIVTNEEMRKYYD